MRVICVNYYKHGGDRLIIEFADFVTKMQEFRYHYAATIEDRQGIEF